MTSASQALTPLASAAAQAAGTRRRFDEPTESQRASRRLSLDTFYRPVTAVYGGVAAFLKLLWRIVVAILQRIAQSFNVSVEAPEDPPVAEEGATANFVAQPGDPAGASKVEMAARQSAYELSSFVSGVIKRAPDLNALMDARGEAYLALVLTDLGQAMVDLRNQIAKSQGEIQAALAAMAADIGTTPQSLQALIECWKDEADAPMLKHALAAEVVGKLKSMQEDHARLLETQISFGEHAIAALRSSETDCALKRIAIEKISKFAEADMAKRIFAEAQAKKDIISAEITDNSTSPQLHSQKTTEALVLPKRKSRVGMSGGHVPDAPGQAEQSEALESDSRANRAERERQ